MARPRINLCIPGKYLSRKNQGRFAWAGRPETARGCHGADTASAMAKTRKGLSQRSPSSPLRSTMYLLSNEARKEDRGLEREPAAGILHRRRRAMPPELRRLCQFIACFPGLTVVEVGKAETAPSPRMCVIVHWPPGTKITACAGRKHRPRSSGPCSLSGDIGMSLAAMAMVGRG